MTAIVLLSVLAYCFVGSVFAGFRTAAYGRKVNAGAVGDLDIQLAIWTTAFWPFLVWWDIGMRIETWNFQRRVRRLSVSKEPLIKRLLQIRKAA